MIKTAEEFVLLRSSEDPKEYLRAANEDAEMEVWMDVIRRFPEMSVWVAHNKAVPDTILEVLVRSTDSSVRFMVAAKNRLSADLMMRLAKDNDPSIRQRIAYHKKAPREVLEALARDPEPMVADVASSRLGADQI